MPLLISFTLSYSGVGLGVDSTYLHANTAVTRPYRRFSPIYQCLFLVDSVGSPNYITRPHAIHVINISINMGTAVSELA